MTAVAASPGARHAPRSRRALLGSALGALVALVATPAGGPGRAARAGASDDGPVLLGEENRSQAATRIRRTTAGPALVAHGSGPGVGVSGTTETGIAVYGVAESGQGVVGSSETGTGVEAVSSNGIALQVRRGRVRLDGISGVARIPAGDAIAIVTPAATVAPDAFVLLTPMSDLAGRDLWFRRRPEAGAFAIQLSAAAEEDVFVSWLMLG